MQIASNGSRKLPQGAEGTVLRLGRKNITVDFNGYGPWRVPAGWLGHVSGNGQAPAPAPKPRRRPRRRKQYQETPPHLA